MKLDLENDIRVTVLNPTNESLDNLATKWYNYLKVRFTDAINEDAFFDDAFELMMEEIRQTELDKTIQQDEILGGGAHDWVEQYAIAFEDEDRSETNASSITFLLDYQGKKMLFLGDAIPSQVIGQIQELITADDQPLHLDVLKVAHHGAWSNNNPVIFELITADYFLFSSNGFRHHHPHLSTLASILKKCRTASTKTFAFNYRQLDRLMVLDDPIIQEKYNYKVLWPEVNSWGQGTDGYLKIHLD
jgi:hypothetical protein